MASSIFRDCGKSTASLIKLSATFARVSIGLNNKHSAERVYLDAAMEEYCQKLIEESLLSYIEETISTVDRKKPDYSIALKTEQKECLVVYSIVRKLLEGSA